MSMRLIWIFWPSFVVGGMAWAVFFALFDPAELPYADLFHGDRLVIYTLGFFMFWGFAAASSAFTMLLERPAGDLNRYCQLEPQERPRECPQREEPGGDQA